MHRVRDNSVASNIMENTKRDLSLDFTKPRHPRTGQTAPSLVTPILNLSTPELNKMISEEELAVLTPNGISSVIPQSNVLPSPLIPTTVNCNNIINNLHTNHSNNNNSTNVHGVQNGTTNNLHNSNKCNGTSHHGSQNHSQNGQSQKRRSDKSREVDVEKIEKKRERNRLAAKKCRQRKLETIEDLRKTVSDWEKKYNNLELAFEEFKRTRSKELEVLRRENAEMKNLLSKRDAALHM